MTEKVVLIADPGIDTAFAVALALHDPRLDVLALAATAGNVPPGQATRNVHVLIEQMDPPRWPRLGEALPIEYELSGAQLHGPDGLGGMNYPCSQLHNIQPSDKVVVDCVRDHPGEVTVVCLGPPTVLSAAIERDPELPQMVQRLVCLGGTVQEPGNAGPVSEFHFACDPLASRHVLRCGAPITWVPLDVMRQVLLSPSDLLNLPNQDSATCQFLKTIVAHGIRAASNVYGVEGFHLKDVLGVVAVSLPEALTTEPAVVDVEVQGELTRGMSVVDRRPGPHARPNVEMATDVDVEAVRAYMHRVLGRTGGG